MREQDVFPSDSVTDACKRLGYQFTEQLFYEAAKDAGFRDPKDRGMALHRLWVREGYDSLPNFCKEYVLRMNEVCHERKVTHITVKD